jgi:hypothetical protein
LDRAACLPMPARHACRRRRRQIVRMINTTDAELHEPREAEAISSRSFRSSRAAADQRRAGAKSTRCPWRKHRRLQQRRAQSQTASIATFAT